MTARKPAKPKPRKTSKRTELDELRSSMVEGFVCVRDDFVLNLDEIFNRLEALETRAQFRDASHDEPVSNEFEVVGQHYRIMGEKPVSRWRRFLTFMAGA